MKEILMIKVDVETTIGSAFLKIGVKKNLILKKFFREYTVNILNVNVL